MSALFVAVLVLFIVFLFMQKPEPQAQTRESRKQVPRLNPVYIDPPTAYLDEVITYSEWNQDSSL